LSCCWGMVVCIASLLCWRVGGRRAPARVEAAMRRYVRTARATAPAAGRGAVNRVVRVVLMIRSLHACGRLDTPSVQPPAGALPGRRGERRPEKTIRGLTAHTRRAMETPCACAIVWLCWTGWRVAPALGDGEREVGMSLVTVRFHGQPEWAAGEYPTRAAAARAAADLSAAYGPNGVRPVGGSIARTDIRDQSSASVSEPST
jgi:hypothetical protein